MLTDKKNIDQLFESKLRDYEVTPPASLWNRIETELNKQDRAHKVSRLKGFGIAAAVLSAFLAGWWLSGHTGFNGTPEQISAEAKVPITEETLQNESSAPIASGFSNAHAKETENHASAVNPVNHRYKPSLASIASFASNTSFLNKNLESSATEVRDTVLFDVEKEFLSHFQNNNLIKRFSDWFSTTNNNVNSNCSNHQLTQASQTKSPQDINKAPSFNPYSKEETVKKTGNWMLSAGIGPVSVSRNQGGNSIQGQNTSSENSFSASMLAGYKFGKRIVMKSGIMVSQLKQVTKNMNYPATYSSTEIAFRTAHVTTPSGSVRFAGTAALKSNTLLSQNIQPLAGSEQNLKQEFSYIEIPVQVGYKLIDRKINLALTGGISTNILSGNSAGLYENGQKVNSGQTSNLREITYSGSVGMEIGYDLGNRITLTVEPRIKHFLNSLSSNSAIDYKPYLIDIITGVTYSFN
jgi:hypothetical protein